MQGAGSGLQILGGSSTVASPMSMRWQRSDPICT